MPEIKYLNTDLDLACDGDISALAAALAARGVHPLWDVVRRDGGSWFVTFETDEQMDEPEASTAVMLKAIGSLRGKARALWSECTLREFNIGYDCGERPWAFNNGLSNHTLRRMADVGATRRITLYPPEPPSKPSRS